MRIIPFLPLSAALSFAGCTGAEGDTAGDPEPDCAADAPAWGQGGALMLPGTDCLSCHTTGGDAALRFTVGGTVFAGPDCPEPVDGAVVAITDAGGETLELVSNESGNFYTTEPLALPLTVEVRLGDAVAPMHALASGACGACHLVGAEPGYVHVPSPRL